MIKKTFYCQKNHHSALFTLNISQSTHRRVLYVITSKLKYRKVLFDRGIHLASFYDSNI